MKRELELELVNKYPQLFKDYEADPASSCMAFGCECGDGWFHLIEKACRKIMETNPPEGVYFAQIKQKFGELRLYMSGYTEEVDKIIEEAENKSWYVCEVCGTEENVTHTGGYVETICENCLEEEKNQLKKYGYKSLK